LHPHDKNKPVCPRLAGNFDPDSGIPDQPSPSSLSSQNRNVT
jgi:hypothetical protein